MLDYWYVWIIAGLLVAITAGFVLRFVRPALRLRHEFRGVIAALQGIGTDAAVTTSLREHITRKVMAQTSFAHVWGEYAQTLHLQRQDGGRWRATALAETFLTDQALVDTPLNTEYYKHLPGIMTGLGIIGTFTGLIIGLGNFDVSIEPGQAQAQLRALINAVGHAFIVSAIAITLAMIFTWAEKSLITVCYRLTEHIRQEIDSLFDAGADVEYLERLVAASEISAREATAFKDALARPLADIAAAVNAVGATRDETVVQMIREVTTGFSQQMEHMFAGQMRDLHAMLGDSNGALREMTTQFAAMAGRMDSAGRAAVDAMSQRVEQTVATAEARQLAMQEQASRHAEQLRALIAQSQAESSTLLQQLLTTLGSEVAAAVGALRQQAAAAADGQKTQVEHLTRVAAETVGGIAGQSERLLAMSTTVNQKLQETIEALGRTTGDTIRGMNDGAEKLEHAANSFAQAGMQVTATLDGVAGTAADLRLATDSMLGAAEAARQMLGDYGATHESFARLVGDLKATVDRARREASLSAELTDRLEAAASRLSHAQQQADTYLDGVSRVLEHAHQAFADSVERTLREANRQFQSELAQAIGLLSGAIVDLGNTVEALAAQDILTAGKAGPV